MIVFIVADLGYSPELNLALQNFKLSECQVDEQALSQQFDQPDQNKKWREGIIKSSFNYLLLDPRSVTSLCVCLSALLLLSQSHTNVMETLTFQPTKHN